MSDPLSTSSASAFASLPSLETPPWPTTPHSPDTLSQFAKPNSPAIPPKEPYNPYAKEPQIYGQPSPGLISPETNKLSNGSKLEKLEPYLRLRLTNLDRNRRDILIRFDAQTNLSNFNGSTYRNVSRSYVEFQRFAEQIVYSNPQTIVPALPLPQTSAPTDEEDDRLVKIMLQRWLTRICEDPVLMHDEEVRSFVESDFGYQPTVRPRRKTGSAFNILRRGVPDEDEELLSARFELTRLETQFFDAAKAIDKLSRARKALAIAHTEMGNKLISVATTESHPPLANALRKFGRAYHTIGDSDHAHALSESVILGDSFGYQGLNSKSAKARIETLQQRSQVLEEFQAAVKHSITKRRQIERLKASSNIRPEKVDEALEELEEATQVESILARRVSGISQNLHKALITHSRHAHDDVTASLIEHARASLIYERAKKKELEALRGDFRAINQPPQPRIAMPSTSTAVLPSGQSPSQSVLTSQQHSHLLRCIRSLIPRNNLQRWALRNRVALALWQMSRSRREIVLSPRCGTQRMAAVHSMDLSPCSSVLRWPAATNGLRSGGVVDPLSASVQATRPNIGMNGSVKDAQKGRSVFIEPARGKIDQREAARKLANFL
ncbi:hypothetical protein BS47DRAFT_1296574 [Hydnum rufescens UP504]|uniref:PX domain-containing protein n=1 Tax=Hydnum rufescens UP504 TaxID=1448309 RepID=A0A9P6AX29_9AGAM|nr:hypothetical protein BS47DRAFT_1296574 [Hydnum rufescens UP504]